MKNNYEGTEEKLNKLLTVSIPKEVITKSNRFFLKS